MILKEKKTSVYDWVEKYIASNGGKNIHKSPHEMCWLFWEMNPNRIPLANSVIYELFAPIEEKEMLKKFNLEICEQTEENNKEVITITLILDKNITKKIKIKILPFSILIIDTKENIIKCNDKIEARTELSKLMYQTTKE